MAYKTFTWIPEIQSPKTSSDRVLKAQFGDGYAQTAADGINNIRDSWDLIIILKTSDFILMIEFLKESAGHIPFWWQAELDTAPKLWLAGERKITKINPCQYQLNVTFTQEFRP